MCVGFLAELSPADPADEGGLQHLQAIAAFLYATRALKAPAFAFPWLQLASDKRLMPRLLSAPGHRGWGAYLQLILVQLRFLEPFLRNAELTDAVSERGGQLERAAVGGIGRPAPAPDGLRATAC